MKARKGAQNRRPISGTQTFVLLPADPITVTPRLRGGGLLPLSNGLEIARNRQLCSEQLVTTFAGFLCQCHGPACTEAIQLACCYKPC